LQQAHEIQSLSQNTTDDFAAKPSVLFCGKFWILCACRKTISGILRQTFNPISYRYSSNIFQDHTSSIHESFPSSTNGYNYCTLSWATASMTTEAVIPSTLCLHGETNNA